MFLTTSFCTLALCVLVDKALSLGSQLWLSFRHLMVVLVVECENGLTSVAPREPPLGESKSTQGMHCLSTSSSLVAIRRSVFFSMEDTLLWLMTVFCVYEIIWMSQ